MNFFINIMPKNGEYYVDDGIAESGAGETASMDNAQ